VDFLQGMVVNRWTQRTRHRACPTLRRETSVEVARPSCGGLFVLNFPATFISNFITMEQEKIKKHFYENWWFWLVVIILVLTFVNYNNTQQPEQVVSETVSVQPTHPVQAITNTPTATQKVSVGEEGYINTPSPKAIIALTKNDYKELTKIYLANDTIGIGDFLLSGKGFAVPKGTKVLVTDTAVGARKVRVLEGDNIGKAGWIAMEWVSKTK
jgi:hypothetical protein